MWKLVERIKRKRGRREMRNKHKSKRYFDIEILDISNNNRREVD